MARPREFEPEEALGAIMGVFWRKGFEGTSMQDIEAATGLNKQSLYRIYDDKRAMYLAALRRYDETEFAKVAEILAGAGGVREKFKAVFDDALAEASEEGPPRGCFLCNATADEAQLDPEAKEFVNGVMRKAERVFQDALASIAPYADDIKQRKAMASKLMSFYFGLRVMVKAGMPAAMLKAGARQVLDEIGAR